MNEEIKKIMNKINCSNNFDCYYKGIEKFNKVNCDYLSKNCEAVTKDSETCEDCQNFGDKKYCICPLLKFLIEKNYY